MSSKILIAFLIVCCSKAFGQPNPVHNFKQIGWAIQLPTDFKVEDSASFESERREGVLILERSTNLNIGSVKTVTLITAQKNSENSFTATLVKSMAPNEHYWDSINNNTIRLFYKAMADQAPNLKLDSSRKIMTIDGLQFKEFIIELKINGKLIIHSSALWKLYKNYTFSISYTYNDELIGDDIKKMLSKSHFQK